MGTVIDRIYQITTSVREDTKRAQAFEDYRNHYVYVRVDDVFWLLAQLAHARAHLERIGVIVEDKPRRDGVHYPDTLPQAMQIVAEIARGGMEEAQAGDSTHAR